MVFSSLTFVFLYLPVVLAGYYLLPRRCRFGFILLMSLLFYAWGEGILVLLLMCSTTADFLLGLWIAGGFRRGEILPLTPGGPRTRRQKFAVATSVTLNLAFLGFFKYFNFAVENYNGATQGMGLAGWAWQSAPMIALPLGISFFVFQSMSYSIDVYLGTVSATRNFLAFGTYVTMFPQLVAGPIVRYRDIEKQLPCPQLGIDHFAQGIERFVLGLGKKVLIANTVSRVADAVFALPPGELTTPLAWAGIIAYSLQIYYDFSGYSDMAIGLGMMLGFRFPENFNYPYVATSIQDFWRRWHMTLSSWLRDYLYIPLGGSRGSAFQTYRNLLIVFLLCGVWHGAAWTFVIWGLFHGVFLILERLGLGRLLECLWRPIRHGYALAVIMVSWAIFRAESLPRAGTFIARLAGFGAPVDNPQSLRAFIHNDVLIAGLVGILLAAPVFPALRQWARDFRERLGGHGAFELALGSGRLSVLLLLLVVSMLMLAASAHNPFLYFRF